MGHPLISHSLGGLLRLTAALALCGLTVLAHGDTTSAPQAANAPYSAPIAKLQVTGSAEKFSIDADHADAQSVLRAIFSQANAQFTTDNSVAGQVTMRLSNQSLTTTLDCGLQAVVGPLSERLQRDLRLSTGRGGSESRHRTHPGTERPTAPAAKSAGAQPSGGRCSGQHACGGGRSGWPSRVHLSRDHEPKLWGGNRRSRRQ